MQEEQRAKAIVFKQNPQEYFSNSTLLYTEANPKTIYNIAFTKHFAD